MDYEKKYKEALEVAKRKLCFDKAGMVDSFTPNDIYEMFPELKESEDEKIRKELIAIYSVGARGNMKTGDIPDKDIVAWLEKQGENHDDKYNITGIKSKHAEGKLGEMIKEIKSTDKVEPKFKEGDTMRTLQEASNGITSGLPVVVSIDNEYYHCNNELIAIKDQDNYEYPPMNRRQNPAWSEEDENIKEWIMSDINKLLALNRKSFVIADKEIIWLKFLKDRVKTQQEWTMQDEEELQIALDTLVKAGQHSSAKWLKNVCLVPQNKWKPSDEQMKALEHFVRSIGESGYASPYEDNTKMLYSLLEDLRKLK